jgi:cytochrome c oxidase subunit 2
MRPAPGGGATDPHPQGLMLSDATTKGKRDRPMRHSIQQRARTVFTSLTTAAVGLTAAGTAFAQEDGEPVKGLGQPYDYQMGLQKAASPLMEEMSVFHNYILLPVITAITLFVLGLLIYVMWRYNAKRNPTPAKTTHNTMVEIVWTAVPVLILVLIAIPSFRLLYYSDVVPEADFTIKAIGYQWYWGYEYPDHGGFEFTSFMVEDDELGTDMFGNPEPRLLATTDPVVVPAGATVRIVTTAGDVIHNFALPSFGLKLDAIPGRLNETWFTTDKIGMYYGQCSELCGVRHAFMPISIAVVEPARFEQWVREQQEAAGIAETWPDSRDAADETEVADAAGR